MDNEATILIDDVITFCQRDGLDARLINMLSQSRAIALDNDSLTLEAPSKFAYSYLVKSREVIERYMEEIAFAPITLKVTVPQTSTGDMQTNTASTVPIASNPVAPAQVVTPPAEPSHPSWTPTNAPIAAPEQRDPTSVKVNNTMTPEMFQQMMSSIKHGEEPVGHVPHETKPENLTHEPNSATSTPVSLNSKFTFETFVYGPENKHAYQSAQRFTAFAEVPGQCTTLFIYGKSGLGKTHLLFAIKNFLAEQKPWIRVKYANSQTYIDDFINEIGKQKNEGRSILREYHDADVLIIDDIQNIIGKQASIEYFFSLMDEFIRDNKKVVIASDRAPKDLGMDERLTSRFSSGMLCLVSIPSFEMKYQILKNYYKLNLDPNKQSDTTGEFSIMEGLQLSYGRLTDDQLKHMAEISGNNIRELESFCERCASSSFEREEEGSTLTAEDIDRIAAEYFDTAHKVISIRTVQSVVEDYYNVNHEDLIGRKRQKNIAFARHVAVYLSNSMCEVKTQTAIGEAFGRDHSTVIYSIKLVETKVKQDATFAEEITQLRNKIMLRS